MSTGTKSRPQHSGLGLLLADADSHTPHLAKPLAEQTGRRHNPLQKGPLPKLLWNEGGDAGSLPQQRWGVIVPQGEEGDALLDRIAPLIAHRRRQQDDQPIPIFRAPSKADDVEAALWRKQQFDSGKDTREALPRYQLILGNLDQVPLSIQNVQSIDGFVGRLAFDDADGYRAYAEKVLRYENQTARSDSGQALFFTVHDGTDATKAGYESLMAPGVAMAQRKVMERKLMARAIVEAGDKATPSRDELLRAAAGADPMVLFSMSHGSGAPLRGWKSEQDQRRRQGGLLFPDGLLLGSDVATRSFLPGGIWFLFACFGAGTPESSSYHHWLQALQAQGELSGNIDYVLKALPKPGERPFIAAVPQMALRNPNGPLCVLGHVDLAWSYSFSELDTGEQVDRPARFVQIITDLLKGNRVGTALRSLMLALGAANSELATIYDRIARNPSAPVNAKLDTRRAYLWMQRHDLAGYILLGDPAVQLPIATAQSQQSLSAPTLASSRNASLGLAQPAPAASGSNTAQVLPSGEPRGSERVDALERAIAQWIVDPQKLPDLAADLSMPQAELRTLCERYRQAGRATLS